MSRALDDTNRPDLSIREKGTIGKRVAANTGMMVGAKAVAAVIGLFSLIMTTRNLPISDVGVILFLHAYMLFFAEVATFQSWQAVIRYGTQDVETGDTVRLMDLLRFCIALDFIGACIAYGLAVLGLMFLGALLPVLPSFQGADAVGDVKQLTRLGIPYCTLILIHQGGASTGLFRLFDQFKPLAIQVMIMPVFRFIGVLIAYYNDAGILGYLGAWYGGSFLGYLSLPVLAALELRARNLWRPLVSAWPKFSIKRDGLWAFVWKANIDASLATSTTHLPLLLVMPIFGTAYAGMYKVAEEIARVLSEGVLLLDRVIYPEYARLMERGQAVQIWRMVIKAGALMLAVGLAIASIVALAGPTLIPAIFGADYIGAVPLSILLMIAAALMGVAAPLYPVFFATGEPGKAIIAKSIGMCTYIVLVFALSAVLGETGPGWAAIGGNLVGIVIAAALAKSILDKRVRDV